LDEDKVFYHVVCWFEAINKQLQHNLINLTSQRLKSIKLWHFYFYYDSAKFFEYQLYTLQTRTLQSLNLLFAKQFERNFWNKQIWTKGASVSNGGFDVVVAEGVEGVDVLNRRRINIIENIVQPRTSFELVSGVFDEGAVDVFFVLFCVAGDYVED